MHPPGRVFPGTKRQDEGRALQYFCEIAGPCLSGATDTYFWTHLVMQFSNFEPAVRHSVVAISSLYENLQKDNSQDIQQLTLRHYNAAIRELKTMSAPEKQPLVLLVCILFICIEFLQSNREAAIRHCNHGIVILENSTEEYAWTREYLIPIFRRLSLFPFFFGNGTDDYPNLSALSSPIPHTFKSFNDARCMMDEVFSRTVRLLRMGDEYRIGQSRCQQVPESLLDDQIDLHSLLDTWHRLFNEYERELSLPDEPTTDEEHLHIMMRHFLSIRYETCRIMTGMSLELDEIGYDDYLDGFQRIRRSAVKLGISVPKVREANNCSSKFMFDMGFMPVLCFTLLKCRDLDIRLDMWHLMPILGIPRECLWESNLMIPLTRRIIEIEHGILLDEMAQPTSPPPEGLPPDWMRIRHMWADPRPIRRVIHGQEISGRVVGFFMLGENGSIRHHTEFLTERDSV